MSIKKQTKGMAFLAVAALLALGWASAFADSDSSSGAPDQGAGATVGRGRHGGKRGNGQSTATSASAPGKIRGHCVLLAGPDNPITGPCVNVVLLLNDADGNEVDRERTTPNGDIELTGTPKGRFRIASGSRFYDVASPTDLIQPGGKGVIEVSLKQK